MVVQVPRPVRAVEAVQALGRRPPRSAYGEHRSALARGVVAAGHPCVGPRASHFVQMAIRYLGQAHIADVLKEFDGPPKRNRRGRSGERAVQRVGLRWH